MADPAIIETDDLISADRVAGTGVYSSSGEKLGTIETVMINKRTGLVAYAVMRFGGFLGMGRRHHPLPWNLLVYSETHGGYRLDRAESDLEAAPHLDEGDTSRLTDPAYRRDVDAYYAPGSPRRADDI